jgi:crotonobetainyl-CoA:carnitine CoA-transferase CaiB-like acyl-CoA transferase
VLVENYTAGTLDRLGLGVDDLTALNPRLIYCSMTGFGQDGSKRGHPAYDNVIQAFSGLMHATGTPRSGPIKVGPPVLDYATGAQAAFAIAAALLQRSRTGKGQRIDVAMLDAAVIAMTATVMGVLATGEPPQRTGNSCPLPGYGAYEAADGLLMVGAYSAEQHRRLYAALGLHELAASISDTATVLDMTHRPTDVPQIAAVIARQSAQDWEHSLNQARVPAARIRSLDEALTSLPNLKRRVLQSPEPPAEVAGQSVHPRAARTQQFPVAAFQFADGGPSIRTPPPRPGEHSRQILEEFSFSPAQITDLMRERVIA